MLTDRRNQAVYYFNQCREGCLLLAYPSLLVESLLGIAECCGHSGLEKEGLKALKKGLEYAWLYNLQELELRIYDEIGKMYYILGDIDKARKHHNRHVNAICEPTSSALRQLSFQRTRKTE